MPRKKPFVNTPISQPKQGVEIVGVNPSINRPGRRQKGAQIVGGGVPSNKPITEGVEIVSRVDHDMGQ